MPELIACTVLFIGAWGVFKSVRALSRGLGSRGWPVTRGEIRKARVETKRNSEGDDVTRVDLEYSYSVGSMRFRGKRVQFGIFNALVWAAKPPSMRRGGSVEVIYSPTRPSVSALARGSHPFVLLPLAAAAALVWIGVRMLMG